MTQLTKNFSLEEMTKSNTAIRFGMNNMPSKITLEILRTTCERMEKVRSILSAPIIVSSGFRSIQVNDAVGGSRTSDHTKGLAVDWTSPKYSISQAIAKLRASDLEFDQLIDEFNSWVHISFGPRMRKQVLSARRVAGRTVYNSI